MKIFDRMLAAAVPALLGAALGCTDDQGSTPDDDVGDVDVGTTDAGTADTGTTDADTGDTGEPEEPSGNALDQNQLFVCNGEPAMPPADIRLLDRFEWTRNVGSWYGTDLDRNPLYARPEHRYSSYYRDEAMDASILSLYLDVVPEAGLAWTAQHSYSANAIATVYDDPETTCFFNDADPAPECVRYFVTRLLERGSVYVPADPLQIDALYDLAQTAIAGETGMNMDGDRAATIKAIAAAAWMTADALHRSEIGDLGDLDEHGRARLTAWEMAQAVAYSLERSAAHAPAVRRKHLFYSKGDVDGYPAGFWQAAADGTISDPAVIAALVEAHIGGIDDVRQDLFLSRADERSWDNRGEYWMSAGLVAFFREWLGYGDLALQPPKAEIDATSGWTGFAVQASYQNQVDPFYGYENSFVEHLDDM
ncbi:MAG: hypothetical protein KC431_06300, partial [Myxococcales bacterium]|nr:hypothetical protein [Myxococcales bacterium]